MVTFWGAENGKTHPIPLAQISVNMDHVTFAEYAGTHPYTAEQGGNLSGPFCILYLTSGAKLWVNSSLASLKSRSR
jgi:hypothetical protein